MSDHHTSYTINAMIGRLYLKNVAFQSLGFKEQQSIVLDLLQESRSRSDVNLGEILSDECFVEDRKSAEKRTLSAIFKICSYCGEAKNNVKDHKDGGSVQGFCRDCAAEIYRK